MINSFTSLFNSPKPVIAMLHLDYLLGSPHFLGIDHVVNRAKRDINKLQRGGVDGLIIENWKENSSGEFVSIETALSFAIACIQIAPFIKVPFGINVLNNDYKVALSIAKLVGAAFVELDVLVDEVKSDYSLSDAGQINPFEIKINSKDVFDYAKKIDSSYIPIICFVQPKHYTMLDKHKTIQESVKDAENAGVAGVLITKSTGVAPTTNLINDAKSAAKHIPIGIGSGFSIENANQFLPIADYFVVGSALKISGNADNEVDEIKVNELMQYVNEYRKKIIDIQNKME